MTIEAITTDAAEGSVDLFGGDDASQTSANTGSDRGTSNNEQTNQEGTQTTDSASTSVAGEKKQQDQTQRQEQNQETQTSQNKERFVSRGEKREQAIKSMLDENKRILSEIRQSRMQSQQQTNGQQQNAEPEFIDPPKKPEHTREQIQKAIRDASSLSEQERIPILNAAEQVLKEWDRYETDLKFWKLENGQQVKQFKDNRKRFWNQALQRFPELSNQESELYKDAQHLAQQFPEILHRKTADGEFLIAQLAAMRMERKSHASEVGALKEQVKQLTEKLNAAQKRVQPASQGATPSIAKAGQGSTPEERLAAKLRD